MIKVVLFDADGIIINSPKRRFSERLAHEYKISYEEHLVPFFAHEFQRCLVGKADLKEEVKPYLARWNWPHSVETLLEYWFTAEQDTDSRVLAHVSELRKAGIKCYVSTNNEKYRTEHLWRAVGLQSRFDGVFSSGALGHLKESSGFWESVAQSLGGAAKDEVLVWDDDQANIDAVRTFGFHAEFYTDFDSYKNKMAQLTSSHS